MGTCPMCGGALNSKGMCTNYLHCDYVGSSSFDLYSLQNDVESELKNNLVIIDALINEMHLQYQPEFYVLGGAALVFYKLTERPTLDIDTANSIDDKVRDRVDMFISDQANSVTVLGVGYQKRAVPYMTELRAIKVYLLAQEDLIITKMMSSRKKDIDDLLKSKILTTRNVQKAISVLRLEYSEDTASRYIAYIQRLKERKESFDFE
ncbi:MAG: hypothetical protein IJE43_19430 [Alphaproteobacteria bacterium]|nr:hypothetical protein [Alphaproteobacteria bacterium]